jgi:hypothetical protein
MNLARTTDHNACMKALLLHLRSSHMAYGIQLAECCTERLLNDTGMMAAVHYHGKGANLT